MSQQINASTIQPRISDGESCKYLDGTRNALKNGKESQNSVVVNDKITTDDLQDLFQDKICVLHIKNYAAQEVCSRLDHFLRENGTENYAQELFSENGEVDYLQQTGVYRYGYPFNSTYADSTGQSLKKYLSEALKTMQSFRNAASPYLSPIDKLRVELDEVWHGKVNVATLNGRKAFCGIGRVMLACQSGIMVDQPHLDAVPTSSFPDIHKQFSANVYLSVPEEGGELEIWDVPPVDAEIAEGFVIPEDWRSELPGSIKVKPGMGDLLLLNTRRPHAVTGFSSASPRTSMQTYFGLTKKSDVFLWI